MAVQISDLIATDRLRTGTQLETQDPVNGSDFDTADALLYGVQMDTPSQIAGYTAANIAEVETATLAARMCLNPDETNYPQAGWTVGRYFETDSNFSYPSNTTALAQVPFLGYMWALTSGIAVIKKITVTLAIGVVSSPTAGICQFDLFRMFGLSTGIVQGGATINRILPPSQSRTLFASGSPSSFGTEGFKMTQAPAQMSAIQQAAVTGIVQQGYVDANPIGTVVGGCKTISGDNPIRKSVLFDYQVAEQPLVLTPGTGFQICLTVPPATGRTMSYFADVQWDEWTLVGPSDR